MPSRLSRFNDMVRSVLPLAILATGIGGFMAIGSRPDPPRRPQADPTIPLVKTIPVAEHTSGLLIETDGLVVPSREIALAAEVSGRIVQQSPDCEPGRYVTQGTLLVQIDPQNYQLEVERLSHEVTQAEVDLQELDVEKRNTLVLIELAEDEWQLQKRQLERVRTLHSRGTVTETSLDESRSAELSARNNLQTLRNQLQTIQVRRRRLTQAKALAETRLKQAQLDLARTEVRAPIDGLIVGESVEEDGYVQVGAPLITIEDTSTVEVRCNLRMDELNWLWRQADSDLRPARSAGDDYRLPRVPATIVYRLGGREYAWEGELARYEGIGLDERTRTVPCRIVVPQPRNVSLYRNPRNPAGAGPPALMRGMYVRVYLDTRPDVSLLRLPERAVRPGNVVWCVRDGKLDRHVLDVARMLEDSVLIEARSAGLQAGDRVIVSPLAVATEGMPVREESEESTE